MAITMDTIKELRETTGAGIMDCKKALLETNGDIEKAIDWLRTNGITKAAKKASRIAAEGLCATYVAGNNAAIVEINSETDFVAKNDSFKALVNLIAKAVAENAPATVEEANAIVVDGETIEKHIINATATIGEKISFRRFEVLTKKDGEHFGHYVHAIGGKMGCVVILNGGDDEFARQIAMQIVAMNPTYVAIEDVPADIITHERQIQEENAKDDPKLAGKPAAALAAILDGKVRKALSESCLLEQEYVVDGKLKVGQALKNVNANVVKFARYTVGEGMQKREENFADEVMAQIGK